MSIKCLVFDCDGVILDSVPLKTRAFGRLAEPYGQEAVDRFVMYHTLHGGVSRYKKFEWFFREILEREITPEESAAWAKKFAEYSLDEVRKCPLIPGALQTLEKWNGILPMYICSGAPAAEQSAILTERGLIGFFKAVYGSPPAKTKLLRTIINEDAKTLPQETVMIGDAITDCDAAEDNDCLFYAVGAQLKGGSFPWSENLLPFNYWVEENFK